MTTLPLHNNTPTSRYPEERRFATVLFADVQGFTSLAEHLDFETVSYLIKGIWDRLDKSIESHGGYIDKHLGDGVMALWGAPFAGENDAEAAVEAGLDLQRAMQEFVQDVKIPDAKKLRLRVGINSGLVFTGYVGIKNEYTVIGDTVNVAHRLEEAAEPGTVIIGESTYQLVRAYFELESVAPIQAKGKLEPISAYRVMSKISARQSHAKPVELSARMIARDNEFARIRKQYDLARRSNIPMMTLVLGELGMGKSRLLDEFVQAIQPEANDQIFTLRFPSHAARQPYAFWHSFFREYLRMPDRLSQSESVALFQERIQEVWPGPEGAATARLAAQLFGFMPHVDSPAHDGQPIDAGTQTHVTLRELIARMVKIYPFTLVIDDLQWIDRNSLQLLAQILEKDMLPIRLFILAAARPDFIRENPHWRNKASLILLEPLPIQPQTVLEAYPQLATLPQEFLEEIAVRSEGNPYFLEQIVRALLKAGLEEISRTPHESLTRLNAFMPETIRAALQARLDNLPRDARTVALLASVTGRNFWVGSVIAAARATTGTGTLATMPPPVIERLVQDGLRQLMRSELVVPVVSNSEYNPLQEYIFKNAFLCEVAYSLIPVRNRAMYHRAVGQWLSNREDFSAKLMAAGHFEQAGAFADAAIQYEAAAVIARQTRTLAEAQALQESALLLRAKYKNLT